jgi:hypothetical protein
MQAITGSGLTGHTMPRCVFNIFYSWLEQVQSKVHATGGLADIVRTIDIPTPTLIHTTRNGVSCGHILVGRYFELTSVREQSTYPIFRKTH